MENQNNEQVRLIEIIKKLGIKIADLEIQLAQMTTDVELSKASVEETEENEHVTNESV